MNSIDLAKRERKSSPWLRFIDKVVKPHMVHTTSMTSVQVGLSGYLLKQKNGLLGVTFERRFFVLDKADGIIRYYRKEGAKLAKAFVCRGALLTVLPGRLGTLEGTFCVENEDRMLTLRADTDAARSAWVAALLDAGALTPEALRAQRFARFHCRRIEATVEKPPNMPLGLALAPSKTGITTGHLIVTDVSYGGLIQLSGADFRLGDMLVSVNRKKIESLDGFIQLLRGLVGKLVFELQRVEEPAALEALLQQVLAELAPQIRRLNHADDR